MKLRNNRIGFSPAASVILLMVAATILLSGCARTLGYKKVPVTFRRAALRPDLDRMTLRIGPFMQKSPRFQAGVDIKHMIQRKCETNRIFSEVTLNTDILEFDTDEMTPREALDRLKEKDWLAEYPDEDADFMVAGVVVFDSRDRSGYEADWVTNRYGYAYPRRVYVDRLGYTFALGIVLVDLSTGDVVMEKLYEDDGYAEGITDEISIFFDVAGTRIDECMDSIQGPKVRTKRYLLYR
ncbi:MAG TPA: hypothetical protein PLV45_09345 [bacterium]|nr:hypothetical protein [bacterium]